MNPAARISRVTPGADPVFGEAAAQRTYDHGSRLLFAGTWLPRKGVLELAQAFTSLVDAGHDVHLDVLGSGVTLGDLALAEMNAARAALAPTPPHVAAFASAWREWLAEVGYVDFTGMLEWALAEHPTPPGSQGRPA